MIFYDLDSLENAQGIDNKYLLTAAVASRARSLSEQKGRTLEEENEKFISLTLEEFDRGLIAVTLESELADGGKGQEKTPYGAMEN